MFELTIAMHSQSENAQEGWRQLYSFDLNRHSLKDGISMSFVDDGSGSPVLMVHGNPTWSFYFHPLIQQLRDQHRCIAVDHVGCGLSDKPQSYNYCLDQHIDNLVSLVDELNLHNVTLVAHDWGGAIGMGTVRKRPERFSKIVLLNTAAFPPPFFPFRIRICRTPILGTWGMRQLNLFARAAISMATELPNGLDADVAQGLLAPYDNWANRVAIDRFVHDIPTRPKQKTWQTLEQIERFLPTLNIPKLLVWGMKDWCFRPECLERFIQHWPDAEVVRLAAAGHYVMLDDPNGVSNAVQKFVDA
ncbi:MAG: alpha/beta fold hydrolase [Pirellulaceae bacterium]